MTFEELKKNCPSLRPEGPWTPSNSCYIRNHSACAEDYCPLMHLYKSMMNEFDLLKTTTESCDTCEHSTPEIMYREGNKTGRIVCVNLKMVNMVGSQVELVVDPSFHCSNWEEKK